MANEALESDAEPNSFSEKASVNSPIELAHLVKDALPNLEDNTGEELSPVDNTEINHQQKRKKRKRRKEKEVSHDNGIMELDHLQAASSMEDRIMDLFLESAAITVEASHENNRKRKKRNIKVKPSENDGIVLHASEETSLLDSCLAPPSITVSEDPRNLVEPSSPKKKEKKKQKRRNDAVENYDETSAAAQGPSSINTIMKIDDSCNDHPDETEIVDHQPNDCLQGTYSMKPNDERKDLYLCSPSMVATDNPQKHGELSSLKKKAKKKFQKRRKNAVKNNDKSLDGSEGIAPMDATMTIKDLCDEPPALTNVMGPQQNDIFQGTSLINSIERLKDSCIASPATTVGGDLEGNLELNSSKKEKKRKKNKRKDNAIENDAKVCASSINTNAIIEDVCIGPPATATEMGAQQDAEVIMSKKNRGRKKRKKTVDSIEINCSGSEILEVLHSVRNTSPAADINLQLPIENLPVETTTQSSIDMSFYPVKNEEVGYNKSCTVGLTKNDGDHPGVHLVSQENKILRTDSGKNGGNRSFPESVCHGEEIVAVDGDRDESTDISDEQSKVGITEKLETTVLGAQITPDGGNSSNEIELTAKENVYKERSLSGVFIPIMPEECSEEKICGKPDNGHIRGLMEHHAGGDIGAVDCCTKDKVSADRSGCDDSCIDLKSDVKVETSMEGPGSLHSDVVKDNIGVDTIIRQENGAHTEKYSLNRLLVSYPKKKLLVLDVNGLLADFVSYIPLGYMPDIMISRKAVFKRPFCDDFLRFCFDTFNVGVWSSRTRRNIDTAVDFLLGSSRSKLLFCWDQSHCTLTRFNTLENQDKPLVLKELNKLWKKLVHGLPWEEGEYNEANTLLLDDSPYKALHNPNNTGIFPDSYQYKHVNDTSLGPGGDLRVYLEGLAMADNVQDYVASNPIGQGAITESHSHWEFYSKI